MKKILSILCTVAILMGTLVTVSAEREIKVFNNKAVADDGQEIALNFAPFSYLCRGGEYVYVSIDEIAPLLGIGLGWDSERNAEICLYGENKMLIYPDKNEVEVNGEERWMNSPAIMKDNCLYISSEHIKDITDLTITKGEDLSEYGMVTVIGKSKKAFINDREVMLSNEPYNSDNGIILPMDSALKSVDYTLGWDGERGATVASKNGKTVYIYLNKGMIEAPSSVKTYSYKPQIIGNEAYITDEMFYDAIGYKVTGYGDIKRFGGRYSIMDSTRTDAYRLSGNVVRGGGVTVVGTFGMELVSASDQNSRNYAGVINALADTVPDCNVYNIVVPTSAEFYAPSSIAPNQLKGIQMVYQNLSDKVTPINVYDALKSHAGEKIYFATDHHWTQRGAYYAYREFIEAKGGTIDDLSTFKNVPSYNMVGSFAGFAKGTQAGNIMRANPELLERFLPKFATVGTVFSDGLATRKSYTVQAVNTSMNSYSCFIGGDGPVTIFHTDADSDETILIVKESFGNAFATWAMHNYKKVCVVDPRKFNGFGGNYAHFNLEAFCNAQGVDDIVFINYPVAVGSSGIRGAILNMK